MKCLIVAGLLSLVPSLAFSQSVTLELDTTTSMLQWSGTRRVGGGHSGQLKFSSGRVVLTDGKPASGEILVDMKSITNDDLTSAEMKQKLTGHLKSADFFDVEKYPHANLKIDGSEALGAGAYNIRGTLTIKGKSQAVVIKAQESVSKDLRVVSAAFAFDRTTYDVRYGSDKFFQSLGDKIINDEVQLKTNLFLKPVAAK